MSDYSLVIVVGRLQHKPKLAWNDELGQPYADLHITHRPKCAAEDVTTIARAWRETARIIAGFGESGQTVMIIGTFFDGGIRADRVQMLDRIKQTTEAKL